MVHSPGVTRDSCITGRDTNNDGQVTTWLQHEPEPEYPHLSHHHPEVPTKIQKINFCGHYTLHKTEVGQKMKFFTHQTKHNKGKIEI